MGSGIATALVMAGVDVILKEVNQGFLDSGMGRIKANLQSRVSAWDVSGFATRGTNCDGVGQKQRNDVRRS